MFVTPPFDPSTKADASLVALMIAAMPVIATDIVPSSESKDGSPGIDGKLVPGAKHSHPRLASATGRLAASDTSHTIGSTGVSPPIMFTRTFGAEPGLSVTPITPAPADVLLPYFVSSWIMGTGDQANVFLGVVIGWRKLVVTQSTTAVTVVGVSVIGGSTIKVEQLPATGTRFTCVAIARSDVA